MLIPILTNTDLFLSWRCRVLKGLSHNMLSMSESNIMGGGGINNVHKETQTSFNCIR